MFEIMETVPLLARVVIVLACVVGLLNVLFYLFLVIASGRSKKHEKQPLGGDSIAVILRSGSCREGLEEDVARFLTQDYGNYSVVVVDESGEADGTPMLDALRRRYDNLHVTSTPRAAKFTSVEKLSLTVGIKSTEATWIVQADRHCPPRSSRWLSELSKNFCDGVSVVIAYTRVESGQGLVSHYAVARYRWHSFIRLAYARSFGPYLGDGRNLAYRRELFLDVRGFAGYGYLQGGEGELIAQRLSEVGKVRVEVSGDSQTVGVVKGIWRDYFRRSTSEKQAMSVLPRSVRVRVGRNAGLRVATWVVGGALLPFGGWLAWSGVGLVGLRRLLFILCVICGIVRYKENWNVFWMWFYDLLAPFVWMAENRRYNSFKRQPQWRR